MLDFDTDDHPSRRPHALLFVLALALIAAGIAVLAMVTFGTYTLILQTDASSFVTYLNARLVGQPIPIGADGGTLVMTSGVVLLAAIILFFFFSMLLAGIGPTLVKSGASLIAGPPPQIRACCCQDNMRHRMSESDNVKKDDDSK